ncbi:MAG: hypothetical protein IKD79_00610 [Oscillospiraceae bacterium]|nr:hypothetical protein [Oscillospiraceae bacterium]
MRHQPQIVLDEDGAGLLVPLGGQGQAALFLRGAQGPGEGTASPFQAEAEESGVQQQ